MEWTQEDKESLLQFKTNIDSDDIKIKEQIKQVLVNDRRIIHVLNNKELEDNDAEPDDYFGVNILPYYMITPTQTNIANFICYETAWNEEDRYNDYVKIQQIIFYILCEQKGITDEDTGLARHDLLASLIQDDFNWTTLVSGGRMKLSADVASIVDNKYACRTLTFRQRTDNNLVKTKNGIPTLIPKEFQKA